MAMTIVDPAENSEYCLEFNRRTVAKTEQAGFDINKIDSMVMTMVPKLFWGAFLMHHPYMKQEQTDKILFEGLGGLTSKEMEALGELYAAPLKSLVSEEKEGNPRPMAVKM